MEEPTRPDPRLDGPVDQIEAHTARYHAIAASMSSMRMPVWFTGSGGICRMGEVSASALTCAGPGTTAGRFDEPLVLERVR
jgi:hypothetical protein